MDYSNAGKSYMSKLQFCYCKILLYNISVIALFAFLGNVRFY